MTYSEAPAGDRHARSVADGSWSEWLGLPCRVSRTSWPVKSSRPGHGAHPECGAHPGRTRSGRLRRQRLLLALTFYRSANSFLQRTGKAVWSGAHTRDEADVKGSMRRAPAVRMLIAVHLGVLVTTRPNRVYRVLKLSPALPAARHGGHRGFTQRVALNHCSYGLDTFMPAFSHLVSEAAPHADRCTDSGAARPATPRRRADRCRPRSSPSRARYAAAHRRFAEAAAPGRLPADRFPPGHTARWSCLTPRRSRTMPARARRLPGERRYAAASQCGPPMIHALSSMGTGCRARTRSAPARGHAVLRLDGEQARTAIAGPERQSPATAHRPPVQRDRKPRRRPRSGIMTKDFAPGTMYVDGGHGVATGTARRLS